MLDAVGLNQRLEVCYGRLLVDSTAKEGLKALVIEIGLIERNPSAFLLCTIVQFLSKLFKSGRVSSHPERHIGSKANNSSRYTSLSLLGSVVGITGPFVEKCIQYWLVNPEGYLLHFLVQLMSDLCKYGTSNNPNFLVLDQLTAMIRLVISRKDSCELLSYFKMLDILGNILRKVESVDDLSIDTEGRLISVLMLMVDILQVLHRQKSQETPSSSTCRREACALIDCPTIHSPLSVSALWLSTAGTLNTTLKCLMARQNQETIGSASDAITQIRQSAVTLMDLLIEAKESQSPSELMHVMSENDKDLLQLLLWLIEIQLRLEALLAVKVVEKEEDAVKLIDKKRRREAAEKTVKKGDNSRESSSSTSTGGVTANSLGELRAAALEYIISPENNNKNNKRRSRSGYDPVSLFYLLVGQCLCSDEVVLFDLLLSPETCFLEYMLRITKIISNMGDTNKKEELRKSHREVSDCSMRRCSDVVESNNISSSSSGSAGVDARSGAPPVTAVLWMMDERQITSYDQASEVTTAVVGRSLGRCSMNEETKRQAWGENDVTIITASTADGERELRGAATAFLPGPASLPPLSEIRDTLNRLADKLEKTVTKRAGLAFNPALLITRLRSIVDTML